MCKIQKFAYILGNFFCFLYESRLSLWGPLESNSLWTFLANLALCVPYPLCNRRQIIELDNLSIKNVTIPKKTCCSIEYHFWVQNIFSRLYFKKCTKQSLTYLIDRPPRILIHLFIHYSKTYWFQVTLWTKVCNYFFFLITDSHHNQAKQWTHQKSSYQLPIPKL